MHIFKRKNKMTKIDYRIEELIKTFHEHAQNFVDGKEYRLKMYKEEFPNNEIPDCLKEEFNLAFALSEICTEIAILKEELKAQQSYLHPDV